jgi:hypothetical protein
MIDQASMDISWQQLLKLAFCDLGFICDLVMLNCTCILPQQRCNTLENKTQKETEQEKYKCKCKSKTYQISESESNLIQNFKPPNPQKNNTQKIEKTKQIKNNGCWCI